MTLDALTISNLYSELLVKIEAIQDSLLKKIVRSVLEDFNIKTAFASCDSLGNYEGAVLENIVYCLRFVDGTYPNFFDRNITLKKDLLSAILILCDVGKCVGFGRIDSVMKTLHAELVPLNVISQNLVARHITKFVDDDDYDKLKASKLMHGILKVDTNEPPLFLEAMMAQKIYHLQYLIALYSNANNFTKGTELWTKPIAELNYFKLLNQ